MHLPQTLSSSRFRLLAQCVILPYRSSNLCKGHYLYGALPFFKIQANPFMAQDEPFGAKIIPKCILWGRGLVPFWVLRHSSLSLTDCWWLYSIQLKTSRGYSFCPLLMPMSEAFLYTLIKLYYTKALSDQALSLAPDWILLLQGPRIPASFHSTTTFHLGGSSRILQDKVRMLGALVLCSLSEHVFCCALLTLRCACVN